MWEHTYLMEKILKRIAAVEFFLLFWLTITKKIFFGFLILIVTNCLHSDEVKEKRIHIQIELIKYQLEMNGE